MQVKGSCLCGAVSFTVEDPRREVTYCHCTQCRKTSGHFWAATGAPKERIRFTETSGLAWFQSSEKARRGFCSRCGSSLFWEPAGEDRLAIAAGCIDAPTGLKEAVHIWVDSKGDYYDLPDGLRQEARE